jgi:hypothetical protein
MVVMRSRETTVWIAEPIVDVLERCVDQGEDFIRLGLVLLASLRDVLASRYAGVLSNCADVPVVKPANEQTEFEERVLHSRVVDGSAPLRYSSRVAIAAAAHPQFP